MTWSFVGVIAVWVGAGGLAWVDGRAALQSDADQADSAAQLQIATMAAGLAGEAESAARGYLLSGSAEYAVEFSDRRLELDHELSRLEVAQIGGGARQVRFRSFIRVLRQRSADLFAAMEVRRHTGIAPQESQGGGAEIRARRLHADSLLVELVREREIELRRAQLLSENQTQLAEFGFWTASTLGFLSVAGFFAVASKLVEIERMAHLAEVRRSRDLELQVRERTAELRATNEALESFSYAVSHELRAPMRNIHGYVSLLSDMASVRFRKPARGMLERIRRAVDGMNSTLNALFSLAHVARGEFRLATVDLTSLATELLCQLSEAEGREVAIRVTPGMTVQADRRLVRVLLTNLLGNAVKYSANVADPVVEVYRPSQNLDSFAIRDNGVGFDPAHAQGIFEPFRRLHRESEYPGSGIGLAICKRIVERHHGTITIDSAVGQGTTVTVTLGDSGR